MHSLWLMMMFETSKRVAKTQNCDCIFKNIKPQYRKVFFLVQKIAVSWLTLGLKTNFRPSSAWLAKLRVLGYFLRFRVLRSYESPRRLIE